MTVVAGDATIDPMERNQAIDALPAPYGDVVRLLDEGASAASVVERLGLDADSASTLVAVAEGKLAELLAQPADDVAGTDPCVGCAVTEGGT